MLYLKFSVSLSLVIRIMKHKRVSTFVAAFKQSFLARAENSRGLLDIRIKANKGNRNKDDHFQIAPSRPAVLACASDEVSTKGQLPKPYDAFFHSRY